MEKALVLNIQRFSPNDGEGIRTTVFFKGCGLHCLWCHNPESQSYKREVMFYKERCKQCGYCKKSCDKGAIEYIDGKVVIDREKCDGCGDCIDECAYSALEFAGDFYSVDELVKEIKKDLIMYDQSGGGATLSGGEVMSQDIDFLVDLCKKLDKQGIRINIDTCGLAKTESYVEIAPYVDTFLYDIKTIDDNKHKKFIGDGLDIILGNLKKINELGANINIRIPIIGNVNNDEKDIEEIIQWLLSNKINVKQVNLLPYHYTGSGKYERLNKEYKGNFLTVPSVENMEALKGLFIDSGYSNIFIGG